MKAFVAFLVLCGIQTVFCRSHGNRRSNICRDVESDTLVIKNDDESCDMFIACAGGVAHRFKCFSDSVYSNGTTNCLTCTENYEDYYEDGGNAYGKKTTKNKFTYKQTKRTRPPTNKYNVPTRPPVTYPPISTDGRQT